MNDLLAEANRVLLETRWLRDQHNLLRASAARLSRKIGTTLQSRPFHRPLSPDEGDGAGSNPAANG
jgi:hypothetical protein